MTRITPELIRSVTTRDGRLFVPERIVEAIGKCVLSSSDAVEREGARLKQAYDSFEGRTQPFVGDYSNNLTVDAYSVYYLPRNTLVPKVAIQCCSFHPSYQKLPERLRVLDLGSGTGGVILGLLDLFRNKNLHGTRLDMIALDSSHESLMRQKQLVASMGLDGSTHQCGQADLTNPTSYTAFLESGAPYDFVFASSIFGEIDGQATADLLEHVAPLLSDNGTMVLSESHSNYAMRQQTRIVKKAPSLGLRVFYPCPPDLACPKTDCWSWRTDSFECPDIVVGATAMETTKVHKAHWLVLSKRPISIYRALNAADASPLWGVAAPCTGSPVFEGDWARQKYEFCTSDGRLTRTLRMPKGRCLFRISEYNELIRRGSMIGIPIESDGSADLDISNTKNWDIA